MVLLRNMKRIGRIFVLTGGLLGGSILAVPAFAVTPSSTNSPVTSDTNTTTTTDKDKLTNIMTKGNAEIDRRQAKLSELSTRINAMTKLSVADKTVLSNEVSSTITGLSSLKVKLDAETTLAGAVVDANDIYSEYRVYALVLPKVNLIAVADSQQTAEAKLSALADKISAKLDTESKAGKDVTSLQTKLSDMQSQLATSSNISGTVQKAVIVLEPTDYNTDHTILTGYNVNLKTAHTANQAALADAKAIITAIKAL